MFAVTASVLIYKEVTSASATMALRLLRTKQCAWMLMSVSGIHVEMGLVKTPLDLITVSATQALNSLIIMIAWT